MHASNYLKGIDMNGQSPTIVSNDVIAGKDKEIETLHIRIQNLTNENTELWDKINVNHNPEDDKASNHLTKDIEDLMRENESLRKQLSIAEALTNKVPDSSWESQCKQSEKEIVRLNSEIATLKTDNEKLTHTLSSNENKINEIIQPHIEAYTKLTQKCSDLEKSISESNVTYYRDKVEELNARIKELSSELLIAHTTNEELNKQNQALKEELDGLKTDCGAKAFEIEELHRQLSKYDEQEVDDIKNLALYEMLQQIRTEIASSTAEVKTLLTEKEASEVMNYIMYLNEKYFSDIPFSGEQFKQFVWNVPRRVYEGMMDSFDREDPDVLNPAMILYLAFTDEPAWMMGHFLTILEQMMHDESEAIKHDDDDYVKCMNDDDDEEEEKSDDNEESDDKEDTSKDQNEEVKAIETVETEQVQEDDYNGGNDK